jgi:hypothetical protein
MSNRAIAGLQATGNQILKLRWLDFSTLGAVMCGWHRLCMIFLTDVDRCGERSCVRPVGAVQLTAGLDEVRVQGPIQTNEL